MSQDLVQKGGQNLEPKKGLEGVVFDTTRISNVIPEEKALYYGGYPVHELAKSCSFEEVAHLLLYGDLPNTSQLETFCTKERELRQLSNSTVDLLRLFSPNAHPMDTLRTAVSFLGTGEVSLGDTSLVEQAINLIAKIPSMVATQFRLSQGLRIVPPNTKLSFSENFFNMCFESVPDKKVIESFDGSLVLYAEHGFNASTFTARVIVSSLSDMISGVTGAIGSLKGSLHGGANEAVMHMLREIEEPDHAEEWLRSALLQKRKVMGFGHRLYRHGDSRVATMKSYRDLLSQYCNEKKWVDISNILEEVMISEKNIYPNLDFPAGPTYFMMGFKIELFTPIFVMARVAGWCAHIIEQLSDNRLVRPLGYYSGHEPRNVIKLSER